MDMEKVIKGYVLGEKIGEGNFAAVYSARQQAVDREVAIKIIYPAFANHPVFIRGFEAEARLVAGLEHPYIVPLYDFWREPQGAYFVMRRLRGGTLRQHMAQPDWTLEDTARVLYQVAVALSHAHRYGVVHRDIKPENILLDESGNAYLADFGIAEMMHEVREADHQAAFAALGSPAYAAPEQMLGEPASPQTDIYGLGLILYEMLTGEHPFPELAEMSGTGVLQLRTTERLPHLKRKRPDLPLALDECIQQATALHTQDRFSDALAMANTFRAVLGFNGQEGGKSFVTTITVDSDTLPNPYKGLRAFQESDTHYFYGRDRLVARLLKQLDQTHQLSRFLAVVGPSGSGKSSVVKAGLIPALRRGAVKGSNEWFFAEMVPGNDPFKELANTLTGVATTVPDDLIATLKATPAGLINSLAAILPPQTDLLLLIDQFEEVFTLVEDERDINRFLEGLYVAVTAPQSPLHVVITLRADFYDRPLLHAQLSDLMKYSTEVVTPMTPQELEQAIVEPVRRVGVSYDPGVVSAIIAELSEQPGALPLLQYALSEMFEAREGRIISLEAYNNIGGVRGALAQRADAIFMGFTATQQEMARQLFLRLITLGEGTEDTRRRVLVPEITAISPNHRAVEEVLQILGASRLLTFDYEQETRQPTVEVTHEAIIREWKRLRAWLDESRNDVRMQRSLASFAAEWVGNQQDGSYLLRGVRLEQYEKWVNQTNLALTSRERNYLAASISERQHYTANEQARQAHEKALEQRAVNRLRLLVTVLTAAFIVAAGLTFFAFNESRVADEERDRAESARATSDANTQLAHSLALEASAQQALSDYDTDLGVLLAVAANQIPNPPIQAENTLAEAALGYGTREVFTGHRAEVTDVDISPDGNTLISSSQDGTVRLWDVASGQEIQWDRETGAQVLVSEELVADTRAMVGHNGDVDSVAFSPDGRLAVSGSKDFTAIIWDVATGTELRQLRGHQENISKVAFSPDGRSILTGSKDASLILWDAQTGEMIRQFVGHNSRITGLAFSPDGRHILSSVTTAILWDVETGEPLHEFRMASSIKSLSISPDGVTAITASADGILALWDLETGSELKTFSLEAGILEAIVFHPNGQTLLASMAQGNIYLIDITTGKTLTVLSAHQDTVLDMAISTDGQYMASASKDQTLRLWNIGEPQHLQTVAVHRGRVSSIHLGEGAIYSTSIAGTLAGIGDGTSVADLFASDEAITSMAIGPDQQTALLGLRNGEVVIWNLATHTIEGRLVGHDDTVFSITFLKNGEQVITGARDNRVIVWDLESRAVLHQFTNEAGLLFSMAVTPDQTQVLFGTRAGEILLADLQTGALIRQLEGHTDSVYSVAISPDGQLAISGGRDGLVILWNLATGFEVRRFTDHTEPVWATAFNADGSLAASASADGTVTLWDIREKGKLQSFYTGDTAFALAFSPSGDQLLTGQESGAVMWWRIFTQPELLSWVTENRYLREFTCIERELYLIAPYC